METAVSPETTEYSHLSDWPQTQTQKVGTVIFGVIIYKSEQMNIPHPREQLEREERLLRRRLREVRRQLNAYESGEAVHAPTYYEHTRRTGEE